eukprot:10903936-Alexandrium_andersonii.AAC.1
MCGAWPNQPGNLSPRRDAGELDASLSFVWWCGMSRAQMRPGDADLLQVASPGRRACSAFGIA